MAWFFMLARLLTKADFGGALVLRFSEDDTCRLEISPFSPQRWYDNGHRPQKHSV